MDFSLKQYLAPNRDLVNHYLASILNTCDSRRELILAMTHSLMAGGKRLRPILAIAAAQACGKDHRPALPAACAIEMIHTYSLIHDDLPAMDNDDFRRGLPTCHKAFSEASAILAGDALLTHAFEILAEPATVFPQFPDTVTRLKIVHLIATAAGTNGMVEGQMLDMKAETDPDPEASSLDHLKKIHSLKTGKMITVSVHTGALSSGADPVAIEKLVQYADLVGLAFQVADDILNIEGDPAVMGKAAGSDALNDKLTFPAFIGLEASRKYASELVEGAVSAISGFGEAADPLRAIADYIIHRDR